MPINTGFSGKLWALITAWLEVRVLPGPPRTLSKSEIACTLANAPQLAGPIEGWRLCAESFLHSGYFGRIVSGRRKPVSRKRRLSLAETRFVNESS